MASIIYRVTVSVGNSCLSMRKVLSVNNFATQSEAESTIEMPLSTERGSIDVNKPYTSLTKIENDCVHSTIGFYQ